MVRSGRSARLHARETDVIAGGAHLALAARADHVMGPILVGAKKRAAAMNTLFLSRFGGINRCVGALGIARHTTGKPESER
jgi:hypothetical protein